MQHFTEQFLLKTALELPFKQAEKIALSERNTDIIFKEKTFEFLKYQISQMQKLLTFSAKVLVYMPYLMIKVLTIR